MKKMFKSLGFAVLIAVIAFNAILITGCSEPSPDDPPPPPPPPANEVTGVSLNKSSTTILVDGTETLFATITPTGATNQNVNWSSDNTAVATVSNGTVTAVAAGTATITVTTVDGNKTATCTVTVSATAVAVTNVSLKSSTIITVGETETLTATIAPIGATNQNVNWSSSNTAVATVNNGTVTAVSVGTATITVTTVDGNKTATCSVTVTKWYIYRDESSSATLLDYSITNDEVCKVTIGGIPEKNEDDVWRAWTIDAQYVYTGIAGKCYEYKFEAWTQSGTRNLNVQYYQDNYDYVYFDVHIPIATTPKTYTVYGKVLPKDQEYGSRVHFQIADQLGTVSIKMLEIKEYEQGKLTMINIPTTPTPDLTNVRYIWGDGHSADLDLFFDGIRIEGFPMTATTIVWVGNKGESTSSPFMENETVAAGYLYLNIQNYNNNDLISMNVYINKVPITFTNGNATINFATQMEYFTIIYP